LVSPVALGKLWSLKPYSVVSDIGAKWIS